MRLVRGRVDGAVADLGPTGTKPPPGWRGHRCVAAVASHVLLSFGRRNGSEGGFVPNRLLICWILLAL